MKQQGKIKITNDTATIKNKIIKFKEITLKLHTKKELFIK